jgi:activator of HSP90 ATPase
MCRPVHHEVEFSAKPRLVYDAYLDSRRHARITGQSAKMSKKEGGKFSAGDAYISGYNVELVPSRRIVQAWRATEWPEGSYSILRLELKAKGGGTHMTVDHLGIPDDFRDGVDKGWYEFYWEPMKEYFGAQESVPRKRRTSRKR